MGAARGRTRIDNVEEVGFFVFNYERLASACRCTSGEKVRWGSTILLFE